MATARGLLRLRLRDRSTARNLYVELQHHSRGGDDLLVRRLVAVAQRLDLPLVATHNVHYAAVAAPYSRLRDALLAIDENLPLTAARRQGAAARDERGVSAERRRDGAPLCVICPRRRPTRLALPSAVRLRLILPSTACPPSCRRRAR